MTTTGELLHFEPLASGRIAALWGIHRIGEVEEISYGRHRARWLFRCPFGQDASTLSWKTAADTGEACIELTRFFADWLEAGGAFPFAERVQGGAPPRSRPRLVTDRGSPV